LQSSTILQRKTRGLQRFKASEKWSAATKETISWLGTLAFCHRISSKSSPQGIVDDTEKNMKSRLDIWITLKSQAEHDKNIKNVGTLKHRKHAEVCGYPMYKDSKTKEPFVLELYRARGAAATCRPAVSLRFPCTSNVSDCLALCCIVLL